VNTFHCDHPGSGLWAHVALEDAAKFDDYLGENWDFSLRSTHQYFSGIGIPEIVKTLKAKG